MTLYGSHDPANPYLSHDPALHGELNLEEDKVESIRAYLALDRADPHAPRFWEYGGEMDQISAIKDLPSQPISDEIGMIGEGPGEAAGMGSGPGIPGEGRGHPDFAGAIFDLLNPSRAARWWGRAKFARLETLGLTLEDVTPSAEKASGATQGLGARVHELDAGVGTLGGTLGQATGELEDLNASMLTSAREGLATYAGQLGAVEAGLVAVTAAEARRAAQGRSLPEDGALRYGPTPGTVRPTLAGSRPPTVDRAELRRLLTLPPPNVEELFQQQKTKGHDISGFRDAEHWWEAHLEHVAQLKAAGHAFAQGTAFAPGGLALVGEMGPELVNLPRGSQVIPNPRLGGDVHVHVTVQGSVVAERDLAQRIRQELIRTSRRTVDLGFSS